MKNLKRTVIFPFNMHGQFKIRLLEVSFGNLTPFDWGIAYVYLGNLSLELTTCHIRETMDMIRNKMDRILNQGFKLPPTDKDIGLYSNDYFQEKSDLDPKIIEKLPYCWILSSTSNDPQLTSTWLYMDANDNIIFEVTPTYPWYYWHKPKTKKEKAEYITYEEFVNSYKPLVKVELSKETAQQWLKQANEIITLLEANYQKMKDRGEISE